MNASLPQGKTRRDLRVIVSAGILAFAVACNEEDSMAGSFKDELPQAAEARLVYDVTEVTAELSANLPGELHIHAVGHTRTGGWTDVALVVDEEASEGLHLVYRFVAVPPQGMATQPITPIGASTAYGPYRDRAARIIEVVSSTNSVTITYPSPPQE